MTFPSDVEIPGTIAVVGAGVMGSGIAQVLALANIEVTLVDVSSSSLRRSQERIERGRFGLEASVNRGFITKKESSSAIQRISYDTDLELSCSNADMVVEAVPEDLPLKMRLFKEFDRFAPDHAIFATNTAGFSIAALAHATARPNLVIGWHWAQPCNVMKLAEIIATPFTDARAIRTVTEVARRCGKNPQVINDQPLVWGFVVNRIMLKIREEANLIVDEGVATPPQIDALMKDAFRWPVGIFEALMELEYDDKRTVAKSNANVEQRI